MGRAVVVKVVGIVGMVGTVALAAVVATGTAAAAVPAGFQQLVDDTALITIQAPVTWTDVDTAPNQPSNGPAVPTIKASVNLDLFDATYSAAGVAYLALPATLSVEEAMAAADFGVECTSAGPAGPYTNGDLTGLRARWTNCDASASTVDVVAAAPADRSFVALVAILTTTAADAPVVETILASVGYLPAGTAAPVTTVSPVATVGPVPTVAPIPTASPVPTVGPVPTASPIPTVAPVPTVTPLPTVAPVPTFAPPTAAPIPTGPTPTAPVPVPTFLVGVPIIAPSLDALVDEWNQLTEELHAINPADFPIVPLSTATIVVSTASDGLSVFGGRIDAGGVIGGRLNPDGAVTELFVLLDPDSESARVIGFIPLFLSSSAETDLDVLVDTVRDYVNGTTPGARDHVAGPLSVVFESLAGAQPGDELVSVTFLAPTTPDIAFASAVALRQAVIPLIP